MTNQVAVTEEMRTTWAAQLNPMADVDLDLKVASLIKTIASGKVPANQIEAAHEMLAFAKSIQDGRK